MIDDDNGVFVVLSTHGSDVREKVPSNSEASSDDAAQRLWDVSIELLKLKRDDLHPSLR